MNSRVKIFFSILLVFFTFIRLVKGQMPDYASRIKTGKDLRVGAERMEVYLPLIKGKKIAIVANQTSRIGTTHLVDSLHKLGIKIQCVFAPEHGFRGEQGAGEKISNGVDSKTGIRIISLYGKHLKPTKADLAGTEVILFDIQDVGARFYTYISTLQYVMEACSEQNKLLILLDRPNPNGYYVDGPLLDTAYRSFIGMNSIPVVHGMTIGEYAKMLNGEKWLKRKRACSLKVIKVQGYTHKDLYQLPVRPSPNLPNMTAVYLYPSLCFFEGTRVSLGRGTELPFQCIGYPGYKGGNIEFTPKDLPGIALNPPYKDSLCQGLDLTGATRDSVFTRLNLNWLIQFYSSYAEKEGFFIPFFEKLAGTSLLRKQIESGKNEDGIRKSWMQKLVQFKAVRKKYLLYPDFE